MLSCLISAPLTSLMEEKKSSEGERHSAYIFAPTTNGSSFTHKAERRKKLFPLCSHRWERHENGKAYIIFLRNKRRRKKIFNKVSSRAFPSSRARTMLFSHFPSISFLIKTIFLRNKKSFKILKSHREYIERGEKKESEKLLRPIHKAWDMGKNISLHWFSFLPSSPVGRRQRRRENWKRKEIYEKVIFI